MQVQTLRTPHMVDIEYKSLTVGGTICAERTAIVKAVVWPPWKDALTCRRRVTNNSEQLAWRRISPALLC
jgi:cytidine deaminase